MQTQVHFNTTLASSLSARLASSVPMPELLAVLGFEVNLRTRRSRCLLHGGENSTAFSWREDGCWHCFNCGAGGDQIALVRAVRGCGFRDALSFLAELTGVPLDLGRPTHPEMEQRRRTERAAASLEASERALLLQYRNRIHRLEKIRMMAAARICAVEGGAPERFPNEIECAWCALASVAHDLPPMVTKYSVLAFSDSAIRARFVLEPGQRAVIVERALEDGYVLDERGKRVELLL